MRLDRPMRKSILWLLIAVTLPAFAESSRKFLATGVVVTATPLSMYTWNGSPYSAPRAAESGRCRHQIRYADRLFDVDLPVCLQVGETVRVAVQVDLVYPDDGLNQKR